jgi:hypothetical protein
MTIPFIFNGMPVRESILLTVRHEDWSKVRSPGRARRRMKNGHRQRISYLDIPNPHVFIIHGVIHGHPDTLKKMRSLADAKAGAA